uniref:Putative histone acetylase complex subunit n=1 Tax=Monascus purpureus TaxID=5098 RepID=Q09FM6_MONPU|nr:putative histone acetylase complex subunit [Monascus purpureus]
MDKKPTNAVEPKLWEEEFPDTNEESTADAHQVNHGYRAFLQKEARHLQVHC